MLGGLLVAVALNSCSLLPKSIRPGKTVSKHSKASAKASPTPKVDCHTRKCVALTFDDGPVADTARLLDTLKAQHAQATFFVLGSQVADNVDVLKREAADGHEIGNHTYTHADLSKAPEDKATSELTRTQDAIKQVTGKAPTVFRPTYGATNKRLDAIAKQANLSQILWSVDTLDWKDHDSALIEKRVMKGVKPGYIILMHDVRPTTVSAVPNILKDLTQQGYAFVTISDLYGGQLVSGGRYPPFLGSPTAGPAPAEAH